MRSLLVLTLALCASGCATSRGGEQVRQEYTVGAARFRLEARDLDRSTLRMLERGLQLAGSELLRWGGLEEPVTIHVLPDQRSLREAIGYPEYTWVNAWARYDTVHLQSPRSWSFMPPRQSDVDRLLLHELSHVMLYQRVGDANAWRSKGIPLWFDEGLASVTAQQAYRWPGLEDLARWYLANGNGDDPLRPSPTMYRRQNALVYGAAHHALTFLLQRYGEQVVIDLMDRMSEDRRFDEAFQLVIGLSRERFEEEFRRYVELRGFKRAVSPRHALPHPEMAPALPTDDVDASPVNAQPPGHVEVAAPPMLPANGDHSQGADTPQAPHDATPLRPTSEHEVPADAPD